MYLTLQKSTQTWTKLILVLFTDPPSTFQLWCGHKPLHCFKVVCLERCAMEGLKGPRDCAARSRCLVPKYILCMHGETHQKDTKMSYTKSLVIFLATGLSQDHTNFDFPWGSHRHSLYQEGRFQRWRWDGSSQKHSQRKWRFSMISLQDLLSDIYCLIQQVFRTYAFHRYAHPKKKSSLSHIGEISLLSKSLRGLRGYVF